MKKFLFIPTLLIIALVMIFTSCEEVIHLDLKQTETRVVIDATLNAGKGECMVYLTHSLDFYQTDSMPAISGANVELSDSKRVIKNLSEIKSGAYFAGGIIIDSGNDYTLTVTLPTGDIYIAKTKAPIKVVLEDLTIVRAMNDPFLSGPPAFQLSPKWKDPSDTPDYYRFKVTQNGRLVRGRYSITTDQSFNGIEVSLPLDQFKLMPGDTVSLEFQCIDSISYVYFSELNDMARPGFISATPYNPQGNFDNGAVGYFGIYFSQITESLIVDGN